MSDSSLGKAEWPNTGEMRDMAGSGGGDGAARADRTLSPAGGGFTPGPATCARCAAHLAANAAFCQTCGQPVSGGPPGGIGTATPVSGSQERRPATGAQVRQFVIVAGRARIAGWLVLGGGAALLLSAVLPWFTFLGFVGAHLPTAYFLAVGAVGALLAYFGIRALMDRATRAIMVTLWVLAAVSAFVAVGLFVSAKDLGNQTLGTVTPASGFYIGIIGLGATIAGTILLQTTRRSSLLQTTRLSSPQARPAVQLSQDGAHWWDGTAWRSVTMEPPPNAPRSADGRWWWDGAEWHPVA